IEPFTNQIKFPCTLSQDMLPIKLTLSKTTSQPLPVPAKLMLEVSGLNAGKFRIVQLPSILICEGGTGLTKPSITPPKLATQPPTGCACAGTALSSNSAKTNSRILIQLLLAHTFFVSLELITPSSHSPSNFIGNVGSRAWTGFRRSRHRRAPQPIRPVTLRRHFSMAL